MEDRGRVSTQLYSMYVQRWIALRSVGRIRGHRYQVDLSHRHLLELIIKSWGCSVYVFRQRLNERVITREEVESRLLQSRCVVPSKGETLTGHECFHTELHLQRLTSLSTRI